MPARGDCWILKDQIVALVAHDELPIRHSNILLKAGSLDGVEEDPDALANKLNVSNFLWMKFVQATGRPAYLLKEEVCRIQIDPNNRPHTVITLKDGINRLHSNQSVMDLYTLLTTPA
jgi:hypothetical protein